MARAVMARAAMTRAEWVRGRRLGVDVGKVRIGVAISDPDGILATPLATVPRDVEGWAAITQARTAQAAPAEAEAQTAPAEAEAQTVRPARDLPADVAELARLVIEHDVVGVVVGLPVTLAGTESYSAMYVRSYAQVLGGAISPTPVLLADERMSTAAASRRLSERGVRGGRRRAVVDQAAAVEILQGWLDAARRRHA